MRLLPIILVTAMVGCGSDDDNASLQDNVTLQDIIGTWKETLDDEPSVEHYTVIRADGDMIAYEYNINQANCYKTYNSGKKTIQDLGDDGFKITYFEKEDEVYEEYSSQIVSITLSENNLVFAGTDDDGPWTQTSLGSELLESDFTSALCAE